MRKKYIDYTKGFAILLLILSHCIAGEGLVKVWIFSFHMPIFFVICGMLHEMRNNQKYHGKRAKNFVLHRLKQLMVPYFIWGLVLIAFFQLLHIIAGEMLTVKSHLYSLLTLQGIESMWFIPCYMAAELLYVYFASRLTKRFQVASVAVIIMICQWVMVAGKIPESDLLCWILRTLIGYVFVQFGVWIERYKLIEKLSFQITMLMFVIGGMGALWNGFVGIGALKLQNPCIFFLVAAIESLAILALFEKIETKTNLTLGVLDYFGKNTIVVVCTNNLVLEVVRLLDYKLTGNSLLNSGWIGNLLCAGIITVGEYLIMKLTERKFRFLFGK